MIVSSIVFLLFGRFIRESNVSISDIMLGFLDTFYWIGWCAYLNDGKSQVDLSNSWINFGVFIGCVTQGIIIMYAVFSIIGRFINGGWYLMPIKL